MDNLAHPQHFHHCNEALYAQAPCQAKIGHHKPPQHPQNRCVALELESKTRRENREQRNVLLAHEQRSVLPQTQYSAKIGRYTPILVGGIGLEPMTLGL